MKKDYCLYYQAGVTREKTWFVVGALRNEDHVAFERAMEGQQNTLEFLVPTDQESSFIEFVTHLQQCGFLLWFKKQANRFELPS
jgi:hypothetical protein